MNGPMGGTAVVMISRGLAPAQCVAEAAGWACSETQAFVTITGFPAVEAKNRAAEYAISRGAALLLVEDDVLADEQTWTTAFAPNSDNEIRLATATCRNGAFNTRFDPAGAVLSSGTPFVLIPLAVLDRLAKPVFVANDYGIADGELFLRGPNAQGRNSDTHFWATVRQLEPRPPVRIIGHVQCLEHRLNREGHDLVTPETVRVIG